MAAHKTLTELKNYWSTSARWKHISRPYQPETVHKLQGSLRIEHTLSTLCAQKLFNFLENKPFIRALGAMTGNQAVQQVQAGLNAIYVSGWQVAADANDAFQTYPDQSLYPVMSVPHLITRINNALKRADQIQHMRKENPIDYFMPIIADAEAGFGGTFKHI